MTTQEKIQLLENKFGNYENWTDDHMVEIASDVELMKLFDIDLTEELLKKENSKIRSMIKTLNIGMKMANANDSFNALLQDDLEQKPGATKKARDFAEKNLMSPDLFMRLNAYLSILSGQFEDEALEKRVIALKDSIKVDTDTLQDMMIELDSEEAFMVIQSAIELLYRIQEFYFERTQKNIMVEKKEFAELCNKIASMIEGLLNETLKAVPEMMEESNEDESE